MSKYTLALKTGVASYYGHDDSIVILRDGDVLFGCETERISREKHGENKFPKKTVEIGLSYCNLELADIDKIATTYNPWLEPRRFTNKLRHLPSEKGGIKHRAKHVYMATNHLRYFSYKLKDRIESDFRKVGPDVPPIEMHTHHECHAASAFYPSGFDEAIVLTADGVGEYESTAVWLADEDGFQKLDSHKIPNSLGLFYAIFTYYLGFIPNNGEGKVMGLAPYGEQNPAISEVLRDMIEIGVDYDVTELTRGISPETGVKRLEEIFGHERNGDATDFDQFEKDLAYSAQRILEDIVTEIVDHYCRVHDVGNVCLAGGVALNCKMNKRISEMDIVDDLFVQPVADDAGAALGAGMLEYSSYEIARMDHVYFGPSFPTDGVERQLKEYKVPFLKPDDLEEKVARMLAQGQIVGWYQGAMEMGPRALGNRSILADPRDETSRDRVNKYVKNRESWRPFAPSIIEEKADEYLKNYTESPFMINTFDVKENKKEEMEAVIHPADETTRPQTVTKEQNPRYHRLLSEFENVTGVPILLNTSFNRSGEPIVCTPEEAFLDFYQMGMDALVINDVLLEK